jgi:hypothetical protein
MNRQHDTSSQKPAAFDQPFEGYRPTHFTLQERARLLVLRGRVQDAKLRLGPLADDLGD